VATSCARVPVLRRSWRQSPGWAAGRAPRVRSGLRPDCPALLAPGARRRTHCARCARFVQTCADESVDEARWRARPRALRCSAPARRAPSGPAGALQLRRGLRRRDRAAVAAYATARGPRAAGQPAGAICVAPSSAASGSARASALCRLTRRRCPSAVSVSERSEFGGATPKRAAQGSRRASGDRHSVSPRRLACGATRQPVRSCSLPQSCTACLSPRRLACSATRHPAKGPR
jgi:hypothetical protein